MMMELRKVRLKPMTTEKPKIIKYESLEPKIVKSDIDKIEFLQDQIREYKRQIKILKKAFVVDDSTARHTLLFHVTNQEIGPFSLTDLSW